MLLSVAGFANAHPKVSKPLDTIGLNNYNFKYFDDCDLCGCTTSGGSAAFGDLSMSNFIGVRYIYQNFESRDGIFSNSPTSKEAFNTYQIWGRAPISDSFFVSAIIPYQDLTRTFDDRKDHLSGLGDINIIGWYQFKFYKKQEDTKGAIDFLADRERSDHTLSFGLGLKLPTGEFEERLTDKINPGFQVGTGSIDVFTSALYGYKKNNLGFATTLAYYFKSENKNEYRFGNQFSYGATIFYDINSKMNIIKPFVGVSGDLYDAIEQFGEALPETHGSIVNGSVGAEFVYNRFLIGAKYTLPLKQDLFGGNVEAKNNMALYLNYAL